MKRPVGAMIVSPLLCVGVLGVIVAADMRHIKPQDADDFHARARQRIAAFPIVIRPQKEDLGVWYGRDEEVPDSAIKLLKPNIILSRSYRNPLTGATVNLLIDQCRDARDMVGHYPPVCYPAHGEIEAQKPLPRDWIVAGMTVTGTEYLFERQIVLGATQRKVVYNFLIVPEVIMRHGKVARGGFARNMEEVAAAAEDYEQRYYGAAQVQMVMSASIPRQLRDAIFTAFLSAPPAPEILGVLLKGGDNP